MSGNQITSLKRLLNDFMYACDTIFQDVPLDNGRPGTRVAEHIFTSESISCKSDIGIPCYTSQSYKKICIRCGRSNGLQPANPEFYPQCNRCNDPPVKKTKRTSSTENDFISKKKQKTLL